MSFFNNLSSLIHNSTNEIAKDQKKISKVFIPKKKVSFFSPLKTSHRQQPQFNYDFKQRDLELKKLENEIIQKKTILEEKEKLIAKHNYEIENLTRIAQAKAREIIIESKDEALALRMKAEKETKEVLHQAEEQQRVLNVKLDKIDERLNQLEKKEEFLDQEKAKISILQKTLEENHQKALERLEKIASMTKEEAKKYLLENLENKLNKEMALLIKQKKEECQQESDLVAREILVDAMKYGATDFVPEYTMSTITLSSEDEKGKIIGKSGRNIHAFEKCTGVDIDLDAGPTEVKLSCFDPVRREIAKVSLERLIKDGRIQPTRIEEVVEKTKHETEKIMFEEGKGLCHKVGIYNLPNELMKLLGRFKYRFSYGQNLIAHTLEETRIGVKIAHELGLNVNIVKLGCLLHDIGKVADDFDGNHVELGVKIAKKFNIPQEVINCIAQHHEDEPFSGPEQIVVYIADAISGARPGARYENYDEYVKRLQKLEEIAISHQGVKQAYAIQAGREIRVMLEPDNSKDEDVLVLANKIKDEIKEKLTYPGTVTVTVIRELRQQSVAK